ncbi:endonuclease V [Alloactinosynnema sp. L-07]|uniref:endonuclease V n=1 Tax=Alloactinosynnema sp. L-07 TaxID=1653480 RepID=UPI0018D2895F|nr:endonuclease V [Alloactinosynnema sp. L-07]
MIWPSTEDEAVAEQLRLRDLVVDQAPDGFAPKTVAGLDVHYTDIGVAAVVVLDLATLEVVDQAVVKGEVDFPYIPGLFAFRELPLLLPALDRLTVRPDVLVCDGQGIAHPRRFGLACHAGVLTGIPSIGVSKSAFGGYPDPGPNRGDWTRIEDDRWPLGRALRTREGVKPVFVSVGHRIDIGTATELVLRLTPKYRLPETTRLADQLSRRG